MSKRQQDIKMLTGRIEDFSGGQNDMIHPAMLNNNESAKVVNYSLDEKGTLTVIKGRKLRYGTAFSVSPTNGISAYTRSDGISRLLIGAGDSLYVDTPRLVEVFDTQTDWETGEIKNVTATAVAGEIKVLGDKVSKSQATDTAAEWNAGTKTNLANATNAVTLAKQGVDFSLTDAVAKTVPLHAVAFSHVITTQTDFNRGAVGAGCSTTLVVGSVTLAKA